MPQHRTKARYLLGVILLVLCFSGYTLLESTLATSSTSDLPSIKDTPNLDSKQQTPLETPKQLSKEVYDKVMATMDALLKRLHQQHLSLKTQVENAQMQLLIAQQDEQHARTTYEKLQKQYFASKLKRASAAAKLKAALKAFKQAQKESSKSLSRYNKMIKAKTDVDGKYQQERKKLATLKKKAQELLDIRNKQQKMN
ncbi:hypothetical protein C9374_002836 [Naegleria lovaniensis]|uniref:Uncharacterized protein n=1 Tax=Naegleria lovaniensis TaxID=51637 RepID=A0AA88GP72_NAELO|nr:uncharacterized protein C9374_002836 [Naegleria lovaniensis]KAG2386390.1 hypothetical protein C9374_002836 [Naegleria lovaniensis]